MVLEMRTPGEAPLVPNFIRHHRPDKAIDLEDASTVAPKSLLPSLKRPDYYSSPSIEMMSKMTEKGLMQVDNLEIGHYVYGSVKWPGVTDVRRMDFDLLVEIEHGRITPYPGCLEERPPAGEGLNKEAIVSLKIKPSQDGSISAEKAARLRSKLKAESEKHGGTFMSYDMETWIFRLPHFDAVVE